MMVYLILDTNYWIYLAKGEHPVVFQTLKQNIEERKFQILVNQVITDEWYKHKDETLLEIQEAIRKQAIAAEGISEYLDETDRPIFERIIRGYKTNEAIRLETALQRINIIEDIFDKHAIVTPIDDQMRLEAVELALAQQAPFTKNKNSVGDALILLSTVEYLKRHGLVNKSDVRNLNEAIFVTFNHTDFSASNQDKDTIHPDLEPLFNGVGMKYIRNIGQILDLAPQMIAEIEEYIEYEESWMITQADIMRGKL